jgi:nuclear cap-binding protein subunit 2
MAEILKKLRPKSKIYWDRRTFPTYDDAKNALEGSDTVYIGNLTFYSIESQISAFFSSCGEVRAIKMGLNRMTRTPCGFAFVQYFTHEAAQLAVDMLNGAKFDERIIKVEMDPGYKDGRQWGRGKTGGQTSDDNRSRFDSGRGGWGDNSNNGKRKRWKRRDGGNSRKNGRNKNNGFNNTSNDRNGNLGYNYNNSSNRKRQRND